MLHEPDIATVAALVSEPTRAYILSALMGGEALPASELAYRSYVTPQTASSHLAKLLEGNLVKVTKTGRHRYYSLKNHEVAKVLETLQLIAPFPKPKVPQKSNVPLEMRHARTCYDHLAGKLGVAFADALLEQQYLSQVEEDYLLTQKGLDLLESWEIDVDVLKRKRRKFAYACLDWSERRFHLAGSLGAVIAETFFDKGWVNRMPDSRALKITSNGADMLQHEFGISLLEPQSG